MRTRIFVRERGQKYDGGGLASVPVEMEILPRLGDHVAHPDERELLRVDVVVVSASKKNPHKLYVTKVSEEDVVKRAQMSKK
jgi:hypothetical protein